MNDLDHNFVIQQLGAISPKRSAPTHTFILCPFHGEKTPSGRVTHDPAKPAYMGWFKCFGCGKSTRSWNEIASVLNLETVGSKAWVEEREVPVYNEDVYRAPLLGTAGNDSYKYKVFTLNEKNASTIGLENNEWRGFPINFLRESIQVDILQSVEHGRFYMRLPVYVHGNLVGYSRAQLFKPKDKKFPSYLNKPGTWVNSKGLFPFDPAVSLMKSKGLVTMVVVEGQRDALRLIRYGIPAVCMMGTQSWSSSKSRLLEFAGVSRLILLLDGDEAGKSATKFLLTGKRNQDTEPSMPPVTDFFDEVLAIELWNHKVPVDHPEPRLDPGNMPSRMLAKLKLQLS